MYSSVIKLPIKDVMVDSADPDTNYAGYYALILGNFNEAEYRDLLEFDLTIIPAGYYISKAELILYVIRNDNPSVAKVYNVYRLTQNFNEDIVTYNNQPDAFSMASSNFSIGSELNTFIRIDVTDLVANWYYENYPNYGMQLRGEAGLPGSLNGFYSSNFSNEYYYPKLEISFEQPVQIFSRSFTENKESSLITTDSFQYSQNYDVSEVSQYTIFINNNGALNACNAFLQISPDAVIWYDDSVFYTVMPGEIKPIVPKVFSKFARIGYQSTSFGNSTTIDINVQMQA